ELADPLGIALGKDLHPPVTGVACVTGETQLERPAPHPTPEADALHSSVNPDDRAARTLLSILDRHHDSITSPSSSTAVAATCQRVARVTRVTGWPRGPGSLRGAATAWPRLARRTAVRRPVHEGLAPDQGAAPRARLALPAVGVQRAVEVAGCAVDVDVERVEARAT